MTPRRPWEPGSPWRLVAVPAAIALGAVGAISATRLGLPLLVGAATGATAAVLGTLALPSLPTRRVVTVLLGLGGLAALRHSSVPGADTGWLLVVWAGGTLVALVLADRGAAEEVEPLPGAPRLAPRAAETARTSLTIAVIVAIAAVAFAPTITARLGRHVWPGREPGFGDMEASPSSLNATDRLDMTRRPRLSNQVVFTVQAARGEFWRGQTFDRWDGSSWTHSDPRSVPLVRAGSSVRVTPDPLDDGARVGTALRQTFHLQSGFSDVVFAAPSPVSLEIDEGALRGHVDGTVTVIDGGLGKGAIYTVTSRRVVPTEATLRAAGARPVPAAVRRQYAQTPETTARVRRLGRSVTAGIASTYDKIRAIERYLGAHVRYSLQAPLAPSGVDVVDDFLFRSRLGWCEQIASTLVVLARAAGIPARLATGFVPGERDAVSGQFVVRERDAHAWAEIYFPGVGWQPFDPTASVPLGGVAGSSQSLFDAARAHPWLLGALALVLLAGTVAAPELVERVRRRLARRRLGWARRSLLELERVGRRAGRARHPAETPREYAAALAAHLGDGRLYGVGATLDVEGYSPAGAAPDARAEADAVLSSLRP